LARLLGDYYSHGFACSKGHIFNDCGLCGCDQKMMNDFPGGGDESNTTAGGGGGGGDDDDDRGEAQGGARRRRRRNGDHNNGSGGEEEEEGGDALSETLYFESEDMDSDAVRQPRNNGNQNNDNSSNSSNSSNNDNAGRSSMRGEGSTSPLNAFDFLVQEIDVAPALPIAAAVLAAAAPTAAAAAPMGTMAMTAAAAAAAAAAAPLMHPQFPYRNNRRPLDNLLYPSAPLLPSAAHATAQAAAVAAWVQEQEWNSGCWPPRSDASATTLPARAAAAATTTTAAATTTIPASDANTSGDNITHSSLSPSSKRRKITQVGRPTISSPSAAASSRGDFEQQDPLPPNAEEPPGGGGGKSSSSSSSDHYIDSSPTPTPPAPWSREMHRAFVEAVYATGVKHASPSVILDAMVNTTQMPLTSERVKSRLQKYRNNVEKSKKDFLKEYEVSAGNDGLDGKHLVHFAKLTLRILWIAVVHVCRIAYHIRHGWIRP
jgi:SHAQKYF class myb-like DNA-binding protein